MKYLLYRLTALLLAGLLLFSAGGTYVFASHTALPDPACRLGTASLSMLAGGGRSVETEQGSVYYIDDSDGSVRRFGSQTVLVEGPVQKLNYEDGVLYYARSREEGVFDLCAFDLQSRRETVLLGGFSGELGQVYLVDGQYLDFSCDNAVWELELATGFYRLVLFAKELWSFVPTGCGLIYATGSLFDYSIYADGLLLVEHADDYSVDFGLGENGALVYSLEGEDCQMDLAAAFAGIAQPVQFKGYSYIALSSDAKVQELTPEERTAAEEAEHERIDEVVAELQDLPENRPQELGPAVDNDVEEAPADPADADPNDPQAPAENDPAPTEPEPADPEPTEPGPTEPEPTEPVGADALDGPEAPADEETTEIETDPADADTADPAGADAPDGPDAPADEKPMENDADPSDTAPDPAETETEPAETDPDDEFPIIVQIPDPVPVVNDDGALRRPVTEGVQNIVRRARQMLNVKWTPRQDIKGWVASNYSYVTYKKGVTYTGVPYCQGGHTVGLGSNTFTAFVNAVNDVNSVMYTTRTTYARGGPYYGADCSGFVSVSWGTGYCTTFSSDRSKTDYIGKSYTQIELGDALISGGHIMLVSDVTYNADGSIYSVEISHSNNSHSYMDCCYSMHYVGTSGLQKLQSNWLNSGYGIYRYKNRNSVTYTHDCAVPLEGDECPSCGTGMFLKPGIDVSEWQGTVNWQTVASEVSFALLRVGYTGSENPVQVKDSRFDFNAQGCEDNGIPYGVYFYGGATTPEMARQEADMVLGYIGLDHFENMSLPIFYDVEEKNNILKLSNEELLAVVTAFCQEIEDFGGRAGVYASTSVWNTQLTGSAYNMWVRWVAQYESSVCTAQNGANVWQYSNKGEIPGIVGDVDLNYWLGTVGDMEHRYVTTETSATCTEAGRITYTCLHCPKTYDKEVPALGHNYVEHICTRCGRVQTVYEIFSDVRAGKWYSEAVEYVFTHSLLVGKTEDSFGLTEHMDRAMLVTVLYRLAGKPPVEAETLFEDVKPGSYYEDAVIWGSHYGVIYGTSPTKFSPKEDVSRQQVATFLFRYLMNLDPENADRADLSAFPDAGEVSDFAKESMAWAVEAEIIHGMDVDGTLCLVPGASATRAEVSVMLMHFCRYLEQKGLAELNATVFQPMMR